MLNTTNTEFSSRILCWKLWLLPFSRKIGDKHGKKLMDTLTKTGTDAAATACKKLVQETAGARRDLIGIK